MFPHPNNRSQSQSRDRAGGARSRRGSDTNTTPVPDRVQQLRDRDSSPARPRSIVQTPSIARGASPTSRLRKRKADLETILRLMPAAAARLNALPSRTMDEYSLKMEKIEQHNNDQTKKQEELRRINALLGQ